MPKHDASRNFIIVAITQERWQSFVELNADVKEAIREDTLVQDYSAVLPSNFTVNRENVVRRLALHNQRSLKSIQKKLKNVVTFCEVDLRDLRTKDFRPVSRKRRIILETNEWRCCDCGKLRANKTQSHSTSGSEESGNTPDRRQDLSNFEALEKRVKLENTTKIEC